MREGKAIGKGRERERERGRTNIVFVQAFQDESQVGLRLTSSERRKKKEKSIEFSRSINSSDRYPTELTRMERRERRERERQKGLPS